MADLKEKIADAELVLVGIGEEFEIRKTDIEKNKNYALALSEYGNDSLLYSYIEKYFVENSKDEAVKQREECYQILSRLINQKNYFLVSLCKDGLIQESGIDKRRIVEPCGTIKKLQCSDGCVKDLYEPDLLAMEKAGALIMGKVKREAAELPVCPKCGAPLVFNHVSAKNYIEEGYLEKWKLYTKWLQGTVNRRVCILELGAGMQFPTVIRWPFEKITYLSKKSFLFRVHSKLYQTPKEIRERSLGIEGSPIDFLKELSNAV